MTCQANPPPPAGYAVWRGPVPAQLTAWAVSLRDNALIAAPYGAMWTASYENQTIVARKDRHSWTYRKHPDGSTVLAQNICIPGITLYKPIAPAGVAGLGVDYVLDPATAAPDVELALYPVPHEPPPTSFWGPALGGAVAGGALVALIWWARS